MAIGDGANDIPMIEAAGLGVAYHGKPAVAQAAAARIDHGDLTALLYAQGYLARGVRHAVKRKRAACKAALSHCRVRLPSLDRQRHEQHVAFGGRDQQQRGLLAGLLQRVDLASARRPGAPSAPARSRRSCCRRRAACRPRPRPRRRR